jgi:predicted nucleic acid-binding protein
MTGERHRQGLLDTNILILRPRIDPGELPDEMAISAITLAELSAGPHQVRRNDEQAAALIAAGRTPRRRVADLMIAATAIAEGLPLYTTSPDDAGLDSLLPVMGLATASPARTPQLAVGLIDKC